MARRGQENLGWFLVKTHVNIRFGMEKRTLHGSTNLQKGLYKSVAGTSNDLDLDMLSTKPDTGWAWVIVLASFGSFFVTGYVQFASGMMHIVLLETYNAGVLKTSWVSAIMLCLLSVAGTIAGALINRFNCRVSMLVGAAMSSSGVILTAFVPNINWTFLTLGVIAGTGFGICYNTGLLVLGFNFEKKCNLACGLAISGAGIGPFIMTPIYQYIYDTYNAQGYFLLLGGLCLQYFVIAFTYRESEIEIRVKQLRKSEKHIHKVKKDSYLSILKNIPFLFVCISLFLADVSIYLLYIHFPEFCLQTNSTKSEIGLFLSIAGICSAAGKLLFGMATNSLDIEEIVMVFGTFSLVGTVTIIYPIFRYSYGAKVIFSIVLGGYCGNVWTCLNSIVVQILSHDNLAQGMGYLMIYVGLGTLLGPPLAGFIIDSGGTYSLSFVIAGILFLAAAFLGLFSSLRNSSDTKRKERQIADMEITIDQNEKDRSLSLANGRIDVKHTAHKEPNEKQCLMINGTLEKKENQDENIDEREPMESDKLC